MRHWEFHLLNAIELEDVSHILREPAGVWPGELVDDGDNVLVAGHCKDDLL